MPQDDKAGAGPIFSLDEIVDLERYAEHRSGSGEVDYLYDGINFWCGDQGRSCSQAHSRRRAEHECSERGRAKS